MPERHPRSELQGNHPVTPNDEQLACVSWLVIKGRGSWSWSDSKLLILVPNDVTVDFIVYWVHHRRFW